MAVKYDRIGDGYDGTRRPDPPDRRTPAVAARTLHPARRYWMWPAARATTRSLWRNTGWRWSAGTSRGPCSHRPGPSILSCPSSAPIALHSRFADDAFTHAITTLAIHHMADLTAVLLTDRLGVGLFLSIGRSTSDNFDRTSKFGFVLQRSWS